MQSIFGADAEEAVSVEGISDEEDAIADSIIFIEEEKKEEPNQENKLLEELEDVLDNLAYMSPSPKNDANNFDKRLPSLGSVDSKPNSVGGGDQKIEEYAGPTSNLKSIAEMSSDQKSSLSMMGVKVEIVNDKEICAEAETSSSSDESDE